MSDIIQATPKPVFTVKHELQKLSTDLKKVNKRAVETLEELLKDPDPKVKLQAARELVRMYIHVADLVRKDTVQAKLLDMKLNGALVGNGSTAGDDDTPALDFNNISEEFRDTEVFDMSDVGKI